MGSCCDCLDRSEKCQGDTAIGYPHDSPTGDFKGDKESGSKKYAKAKIDNGGSGSAYPEGFTVDADISGPIRFPLHVRAVLTSNPKGDERMTELDSHFEGTIDRKGELKVNLFKLGYAAPPHGAW